MLVGKTTNYAWSKDAKHRQQCEKIGIFPEVWGDGALPWRLSAEQRQKLDKRTSTISWPHYVEPLYYRGASFWIKPSRMWKSRRKYRLLLFFLPVLIRDQVPRLREALLLLTWAMRRLEGQVHSYEKCEAMGVLPGSFALKKAEIDNIGADLLRGLVLLEGCIPISYLIPSMHHFVHFAEYTKTHGILRLYWMMAFERYNKYIKNLCRDMNQAEVNVSRNATVDFACDYRDCKRSKEYVLAEDPHHNCVLSMYSPLAEVTPEEFDDLQYLGCPVRHADEVYVFNVATILNKHFRSGEWGQYPRCGSVITCVMNGRSLYARVVKFMKVDGDPCPGYASVHWFSEPTYVNRLCPQVTLDGDDVKTEVGVNLVRITQIDPSRVSVEHAGDSFFMIRDSGYDTVL